MKINKQLQLYWEDVGERVVYAELDDYAWKLAEKMFGYRKMRSLYIFNKNKLAAYYSKRDSEREAVVGLHFYHKKKKVSQVIQLKKKMLQEVVRHVKSIHVHRLHTIPVSELKDIVIDALNLYSRALSVHYLTQPQFFEKFEISSKPLSNKSLQTISKARFFYTRRAWRLAFKLCKQCMKAYGDRLNIYLQYLESLTYEEICNDSLKKVVARRRAHSFAMTSNQHRIRIYTGADTLRFIRRYEKYNGINMVHGVVGNIGKTVGKAFIVKNEYLDLNKLPRGMKKGMILVVQNAWPEFAPYYKFASAIVTNEGGITSHGVVVSRELNIPCIVGTKIATKVFKTGDRVEVDANKGVVKKI